MFSRAAGLAAEEQTQEAASAEPVVALGKDLGTHTLVVPRADGFGVSQAVQDLIERFRPPPVYAPLAICCLPS